MNHFFLALLVIGNVYFSKAQSLYRLPASITTEDYLSKTIILKVSPAYSPACTNHHIAHPLFNNLASAIGTFNLHKKFPLDRAPEKEYNEAGQKYADLSLIYELNYTADLPVAKAIQKLLLSGILHYAEPHFIPRLTYNPNDPSATVSTQYHLQTVNAYNAWNIDQGDSSIVIGITDTGTDLAHPDLFNNAKRNYGDVVDGLDNDNDGYVDNYLGWDVALNDNDPTWQSNAHGVHVCGIASASTDNGIGIAGLGFKCKFLPVKIGDANAILTAAYEGIKYAADHGSSIINCSWGGGGISQYAQDIIDYASINKNCLVVASAGNNGADGDFYPAALNYVMSVANTSGNDVKYSNSNYGYFVDVCAPGDNIYSTWPSNTYVTLTGTSMSSPLTAGAAAIVKHHFPSYTGLQVGERLKVTSDNIYPVNPSYTNKLGSGRINLFRALNDPASPSVVFSDKIISDHNDEAYISGDTLFITGKFTNYLDPTSALNVTVTPLSTYATPIDNNTSLGIIGLMANKTNATDPFRFKLTGAIPINQTIDFEVAMQDGSYQAKQYFTVFVNIDYLNITINDVSTTATSKGKIGYNQDGQGQGLGFQYKGVDLLYDGGFMIGKDTANVSDCVRGTNVTISEVDFGATTRIARQFTGTISDFDSKAKYSDNIALNPLPVEIEQNTLAWSTNPNKQFVIWEYLIKNTHATDTLKHVFAGIFADWDIDGGSYNQNRSAYEPITKMGYSYYTAAGGKYAGIKLLTSIAPPNFYAFDNVSSGNGGIDITNGFDTKEKYLSLSTQRLVAGVGGNGNDISNTMSTGPLTIYPNQTIKIAFAVLGADSLQNLLTAANQSQMAYSGLITSVDTHEFSDQEVMVFPNPTNAILTISQPTFKYQVMEVYTLDGSLLLRKDLLTPTLSLDMKAYAKGLYLLKLSGKNGSLVKKIVLTE